VILEQREEEILYIASQYLNETIINEELALSGARDIIAEWINENSAVRNRLRRLYQRRAAITSTVIKTKKVTVPENDALDIIDDIMIKTNVEPCTDQMFLAIADAYKRLLTPAISTEVLNQAKEKADDKAIIVFAQNLKQLLLASPLGQKRILALDPGFKSKRLP